jgi:hypothetical protein
MQQIKNLLIPTNGRTAKDRHPKTRYTRHEVTAPRAVSPSGRTKSLSTNKKGGRCR